MSNSLTPKELERELRERSPESERLIKSLANCDRRHFLKVSAKFAAMAAAAGVIQPHAFQLVNVAYAADVQIGGQVARLGQRMISGVTREMAGQFFSAFERWRPEAPEEKVAAPPARSFFQLLWRTLLRLLGLRRDD